MDIYYIYIIGVRIFFFFFLFAINSHNLSLKSFDSKSLNTAVCSRRSLLHFFFFFILNRRFVKSNLYFDRKSRILSSLDDHIRIFVSIEKFTGSKIRSDLYIFLSFFSPSLPYCIHARNLSSPLKHQVKHPRDASLLLLPHPPNKPNKMHSLSTRLRFSLFVSLEPESPSEISLSLSYSPSLPSPPPPPRRTWSRAPHELKRRGVARRSTRKRVAFHQYIGLNRKTASERSRRIVAIGTRESEREAIVRREIRILLFTFALPRDNGGKRSKGVVKALEEAKGKEEREKKKWSPCDADFYTKFDRRERERSLPPPPPIRGEASSWLVLVVVADSERLICRNQ